MATVKFSDYVVDARGKTAGTVYSRNRGGNYRKALTKPLNPQTTYQINARSLLTNWAQAFRGLTQAQIDAWNNASLDFPKSNRVADRIYLSGENLYIRCNTNLALVGGTPITAPPLPTSIPSLDTLNLTVSNGGGTVVIDFTPSPTDPNTAYKIWMTPGLSPGRNYVKNRFRQIGVLAPGSASPNDITALYVARFGAIPPVGQKVFVKLVPVDTASGLEGFFRQAETLVI